MPQNHSDEEPRARYLQSVLNGPYGPAIKLLVADTTDALAVQRVHGDLNQAVLIYSYQKRCEFTLRRAKRELARTEKNARRCERLVRDLGEKCSSEVRDEAQRFRQETTELAAQVEYLVSQLPDPRRDEAETRGRPWKMADRLLVARLAGIFETHSQQPASASPRKCSSVLGRSAFVCFLQAFPNVFPEPPKHVVMSTLGLLEEIAKTDAGFRRQRPRKTSTAPCTPRR